MNGNGGGHVRKVHSPGKSSGWATDRRVFTFLQDMQHERYSKTLYECEGILRQAARQNALSHERLALSEAHLGILRRVRQLREICTELDECIQASGRCLAQVHEGEGSGEDQTTEPH